MRIATWNVNSLKARQDAVENWLTRAEPDILLLQETKLTDEDAPVMAFAMVCRRSSMLGIIRISSRIGIRRSRLRRRGRPRPAS